MSKPYIVRLHEWLLKSPPTQWLASSIRDLLFGALSHGEVPQHVAFIMDGNRRLARKNSLEVSEGHQLGFQALARILEVCYNCGVKAVSVYAFSLENFKRPQAEVDGLMSLALSSFRLLSQQQGVLDRHNAKFCFSGEKELLRPDVVEAIDSAIEMTMGYTGAILNVCGAYTSRKEMTNAIQRVVQDYATPLPPHARRPFSETRITQTIQAARSQMEFGGPLSKGSEPITSEDEEDDRTTLSHVSSEDQLASSRTSAISASLYAPKALLEPDVYADAENITADTLNWHTYTANMPPIDLLVRTSRVNRLSDFMLWQTHQNTPVVFVDCLWPEFDWWHFLPILIEWQSKQKKRVAESRIPGRTDAMEVRIKAQ